MRNTVNHLGRRSGGFSLIELAACLVVLGLLTGGAALSLRSASERMDRETWLERFSQIDTQLRSRTQAQGTPWELTLDFADQTLQWQPTESEHLREPSTLHLPEGYRVVRVRTDRPDEPENTSGRAVIAYSRHGVSPTFAIELRHPQQPPLEVLVVGTTGQILQPTHDQELQDIFTALLAPGAGDDAR